MNAEYLEPGRSTRAYGRQIVSNIKWGCIMAAMMALILRITHDHLDTVLFYLWVITAGYYQNDRDYWRAKAKGK